MVYDSHLGTSSKSGGPELWHFPVSRVLGNVTDKDCFSCGSRLTATASAPAGLQPSKTTHRSHARSQAPEVTVGSRPAGAWSTKLQVGELRRTHHPARFVKSGSSSPAGEEWSLLGCFVLSRVRAHMRACHQMVCYVVAVGAAASR